MPELSPVYLCAAFTMKTIRMRSRAMVVLVIGCLGLLMLMKGLNDHSANAASDSLTQKKDGKENKELSKTKSPSEGSNLRPGAKPLMHPPAPQERSEVDGFRGRRVPDVAPGEGAVKWQQNSPHRREPPFVQAENLPLLKQQQQQQGFNPPVVNVNSRKNRENVDFPNPAQDMQLKHHQLPPIKPNLQIQNLPQAGVVKNASDRKNYPQFVNGKFVPPHRVVHFDLKGAAMKVSYFREVFPLLKSLGATGVLLEWEDMFPYTGELAVAKHGNAYSENDIRSILNFANQAGLDIMPLVQTFGHLEWILKHEKFAHLRQQERYAQVICLADDEAVNVVKMAIDQVMSIHRHFPMPFFHMGADEAFQVGMCEKDQELMRKNLDNNREKLMIRHISTIGKYVKEKYNTRVLMWHDMLNSVETQMMREFNLGELVEPVVWAYAENLNDYLMPDMWQRFGEVFPYIWGGSSFKGADGPSRYYSNVPHYLQNHISWTQQMTREFRNFKEFRGLILTGWQRFDHFAVLCEIWPVGIPSVAVNLQTIIHGQYDRQVLKDASRILQCSSTMDIDSQGVAAYCKFPGAKVYQTVQQLKMALENVKTNLYDDYQVHGWLSRFNIKHNYSSAWYLDQIADKLQMYMADLKSIAQVLRQEMAPIFYPDMIDEWIFEYVEPDLDKLKEMEDSARKIGTIKTFPVRPFRIRGSTSEFQTDAQAESKKIEDRRQGYAVRAGREVR